MLIYINFSFDFLILDNVDFEDKTHKHGSLFKPFEARVGVMIKHDYKCFK